MLQPPVQVCLAGSAKAEVSLHRLAPALQEHVSHVFAEAPPAASYSAAVCVQVVHSQQHKALCQVGCCTCVSSNKVDSTAYVSCTCLVLPIHIGLGFMALCPH